MMVNAHGDRVFPAANKLRYIKLERGIAVLPFPGKSPVHINPAVHVHPVKTDTGAHTGLFFVCKSLSVPACGGFVQVIRVVYKPVVRQVNGCEIKAVRVFRAERRLEKFPPAAE